MRYCQQKLTNASNIYTEMQRTNDSQDNLEEKEVGRFTLPDIKAYYKAIVIKKVWYWYKD